MKTCGREKEPNLVEESPPDQIDLLIFFWLDDDDNDNNDDDDTRDGRSASDRACCVASGLRCDRALEVRPEVGYEPCKVTSPPQPPPSAFSTNADCWLTNSPSPTVIKLLLKYFTSLLTSDKITKMFVWVLLRELKY